MVSVFYCWVVLFGKRCFIVYKTVNQRMPETDKCLGEVMG